MTIQLSLPIVLKSPINATTANPLTVHRVSANALHGSKCSNATALNLLLGLFLFLHSLTHSYYPSRYEGIVYCWSPPRRKVVSVDFKVNDKTLKKTTRCKTDFSCLKRQEAPCEIILNVATNVREIFCATNQPCPYCKSISPTEGMCTCPVRKELFESHGI